LRATFGFRGFSINYSPADIPLAIVFMSRNNAGTTSIQLTNGLTFGAYYKIAIAYDAGVTAAGGTQVGGVTAYVNGSPAFVKVGDLRVPNNPIDEVRLYGANAGDENETANGNIRSTEIYDTRLDDGELMLLTSPIPYDNVSDMIWETFIARTSTFSELPDCLRTRHNEIIES